MDSPHWKTGVDAIKKALEAEEEISKEIIWIAEQREHEIKNLTEVKEG